MSGPVVVDASVILKWVLPKDDEPHHGQALRLAEAIAEGRVEAALPTLWLFEVGNILARKHPKDAAADLADLRIQLAAFEKPMTERWLSQAARLAIDCGTTFYDACYHALAIELGGVFVTADEKYLQAAGAGGHAMHIKDWQ